MIGISFKVVWSTWMKNSNPKTLNMFMIEKRTKIQIQIQTYLGSIIDSSQGGYLRTNPYAWLTIITKQIE
jgi:Fe-S cluster biosynthesis and repair protein YggX